MILPAKLYDVLKFLVKFVPLIVTFIGAIGKVCMTNDTVNTILIIVGAVGSLLEGTLQIFKAKYYKIKAQNGNIVPVDQYDTAEAVEEQ